MFELTKKEEFELEFKNMSILISLINFLSLKNKNKRR